MSHSSELKEDPSSIRLKAEDEKPVVGIIAGEGQDEAVARVCLRARVEGYEVFLGREDGAASKLADLDRLDAITVISAADAEVSSQNLPAILEAYARIHGANGLILVEDPSMPIDFEASLVEFDPEAFTTTAIPEPAVGVRTLIAIPAYNEAETIATVVQQVSRYADEVLVVDDGSDDATRKIAEDAGATVISHERNRGYGAALKTAFVTADSWGVECLVIIDGDGQHDVSDVPKLCTQVTEENANVAIGSRFAGDARSEIPLYRRFGLGVVNTFTNVSMGLLHPRTWVSDTQSGFRAYDEHVIESLANAELGEDMAASLDILYHIGSEGFTITELPTIINYDVDNGHSQNPVKHGLRLVSTILRTVERKHPIGFVGLPGFTLALIGIATAYATMANYINTGTFPLGLGLVSTSLSLAGILACFTAIILHSLNQLRE